MRFVGLSIALCASTTSAFPWMADLPGIDLSLIKRSPQQHHAYQKRQSTNEGDFAHCPINPDHPGAAPFDAAFPYTGAIDGLPGTGIGGVQVPDPNDFAHYYTEPGPLDIRGPCPGMNTAANHNFLSHDGITTLAELLDAQQNLYNLDYPLALIIAVRAVALDGDITTTKLSIGCDATSRTAIDPTGVLGAELGLDGHNKFEADTSLTRDDIFFYGDDFSFNGTLFETMYEYAQEISGGLFDRDAISDFRSHRYDESLATNPNFYFGPKAILLYSAASFIYNVFPGSNHQPDIDTISTFYGAEDNGDGTWTHVPERIPANWTNRATAYTVTEIALETAYSFGKHPKLFGGNVGVSNFLALNTTFDILVDGQLPNETTAADFTCLLYQLLTENVPSEVQNVPGLALSALEWIATQINPIFADFGCPLNFNS